MLMELTATGSLETVNVRGTEHVTAPTVAHTSTLPTPLIKLIDRTRWLVTVGDKDGGLDDAVITTSGSRDTSSDIPDVRFAETPTRALCMTPVVAMGLSDVTAILPEPG